MNKISARNNDKIKEAVKLRQKKTRSASSLFCFEGIKLYYEAIASGISFVDIFVTEKAYERYKLANTQAAGRMTLVSDSVFEKLTHEQTPDGIFCVAQKWIPQMPVNETKMIISSVRDPGNVGTIIRSALAFRLGQIVLSPDCADIFSYKVIRASMGACFKQSIKFSENLLEEIDNLKNCGYNLIAASLSEKSRPLDTVLLNNKCCFVIGNEGHGLDEDVVAACHEEVVIPISEKSESLNASIAASILMWEMKKVCHEV
ncbi:MAG: RNA methyltransferase [Clostridiales bacterium]|nr:RNA methyltransferase [Clostridiales bacterium]